MILIADSGSTKASWRLITSEKKYTDFKSSGISPFYQSTDTIKTIVKEELLPQMPENLEVNCIFYYGTGCSQPDKNIKVEEALESVFPNTAITVEHDLLAAARAVCQNLPGVACILGTGSNSCLYDGKKITDNLPSLGFMLGDEGSGGHFGRKLLQAYFYRELPDILIKDLEATYDVSASTVKNNVHDRDMPNQYVAGFTSFLTQHKEHPYVHEMLVEGFEEFIARHVCKYKGYRELPIHFVGSVAFHHQEALTEALNTFDLRPGKVIRDPMDGLTEFHLSNS